MDPSAPLTVADWFGGRQVIRRTFSRPVSTGIAKKVSYNDTLMAMAYIIFVKYANGILNNRTVPFKWWKN
jgi:hypothetical protein